MQTRTKERAKWAVTIAGVAAICAVTFSTGSTFVDDMTVPYGVHSLVDDCNAIFGSSGTADLALQAARDGDTDALTAAVQGLPGRGDIDESTLRGIVARDVPDSLAEFSAGSADQAQLAAEVEEALGRAADICDPYPYS